MDGSPLFWARFSGLLPSSFSGSNFAERAGCGETYHVQLFCGEKGARLSPQVGSVQMKNRREFLSFIGLLAISCVSERAIAKGKGHKIWEKQKQKKASKTTCSGKRDSVLRKKCSKTEAGQTPAQCKSEAEVLYQKCLKTGTWEGKNKNVQLEKR